MIARSWRGSTEANDADRYWAYLQETGIKEYEATPGNRGVIALRRVLPERAEFVLLSFWDDMDAVRRFAGAAADEAVFYPEDEKFLVEFDRHVYHFEVLHGPTALTEQ